MSVLRDLISRNREIQELVTARGQSKNPLEIFREKGYRFNVLDLEVDSLATLKKTSAGYSEAFNPITGRSLGAGTSLIRKANMIQFSMGAGVPGGKFSILENIVVDKSTIPKANALWPGHDPRLKEAVTGGALEPGMTRMSYNKAAAAAQKRLNTLGAKDILVGHNILNADITWLKQSGINPAGVNVLDTMSLGQILASSQGHTGGIKLESLTKLFLGKEGTSHLASEDIVDNFNVLNQMFSPENWAKYSKGQQKQAWDFLMPLFAASSGSPVRAGDYSITGSLLHNSADPMLYRQMKFRRSAAIFRTKGKEALRTLYHSGTKRGAKKIYDRIKQFDPSGAQEFKSLYRYLNQQSGNRINFALEQRNGLEYLNLYSSTKKGRPIGDAVSIPFVQSRHARSLVTYKGALRGTRGSFAGVVGGQLVETSMTGLFLSQMRATLKGGGGIEKGLGSGNSTINLLKAIAGNAERAKVFYGGESRGIASKSVGTGSLLTALHNLKVGPEFGYAIPTAMAGEVQFVKAGARIGGATAEDLPGLAGLKETLKYINIDRSTLVQQGNEQRGFNSVKAIKEGSSQLLKTLEKYGISALGIKEEALTSGIYRRSALHFGLSKAAVEKGTFHLRGIQPIVNQGMLHQLRGFRSPMLMPSGLVGANESVKRLTRLSGQGGRYSPMMGASMRVSMLYGGNTRDIFSFFGDPGVKYTSSALPFLQKPGTPRSVFARELNTKLLSSLSDEQLQAFRIDKRLDTSTLGRVNYSGVLGHTDMAPETMRAGERILDIKYNKASHGYDIKLGRDLVREYETPLLVGTRRTTATGPIKGFSGSQLVGHSMFFNTQEMYLHHMAAQVQKAGLNKEYASFLGSRFGNVVSSRDFSAIGAPDANQYSILKATRSFLRSKGIEYKPQKEAVSGVPGAYARAFDLPVFHRFGADQDLGYKAGNALRLRLDAVKEMAMMESSLGLQSSRVSGMLGRIYKAGTYDRLREFKFGLGLMYKQQASGSVRQNAAKLGLDVLNFADIRGGKLSPTTISGDKTAGSLAGTYLDKYLQKGFVLDLGEDIGMLPMGMSGSKNFISSGNRFVYIPSARMAGFGYAKGGIGQVSKGRPYGKFAEVINLIARGDVSSNQVARRLFGAYESFERQIFGKNRAFERKLLTTGKLRSSASMRIVPQRSGGMFDVNVDLKWLGQNKNQLGITDDFLAKIARGEDAFGYMEISPHQRPGHATLVRLRQAKTGSVLSKGIGVSPELLYQLERDVDKDAARILFLDTAKGSSVDDMLGGKAFHYDRHLNKLFKSQSEKLSPGMRKDFNAFLRSESRALSSLVRSVNIPDHLSSFLSMKGLAAVPWVRTRHDTQIILRMWDIGKKTKADQSIRVSRLGRMVSSQFGLKGGLQNPLISDTLKAVAKTLPGDKTAILSMDVMQRYMQFLLKKAGDKKYSTEKSLDALGGLQARLFDRLRTGDIKSGEQLVREAIQESTQISRSFLQDAAASGELKLAGFGGASRAEAIQNASRAFGRTWGPAHAVRAAYANAVDPNNYKNLGRASALRKLTGRRGAEDLARGRSFLGAIHGLLEDSAFSGGRVSNIQEGNILPIEGDTEFRAALARRGLVDGTDTAKARQSLMNKELAETGGSRAIKGAFGEVFGDIASGLSKLWRESPAFKVGLVGAGGLALFANARRVFMGSDEGELSPPPLETSQVMQNSLHRSPMVGMPESNVQYPIGPNPVDFRQKAYLQRMNPAVQLGGQMKGEGSPFASIENATVAMTSAGVGNGMISISDSRRNHDITASFEARDIMNSDYTI